MARGDGLYVRLSVAEVRGFQMMALPVGCRWLLFFLRCLALEQRCETISRPADRLLATMSGLTHHPIAGYLLRLHRLKLLIVNARTMKVIGLRENHAKLQGWHDP